MSNQKKTEFILSDAWDIKQFEKSLFISGGADARYEIELENDETSVFSSMRYNVPFTRSSLNNQDQSILEQLITAEIVKPVVKKGQDFRLTLAGDIKNFSLISSSSFSVVSPNQPHDISLIVRSISSYAKLLDRLKYPNLAKPHLFIDMAFHHTLSIGPLVFPGETACIACLQGRINRHWGDTAPPETPLASNQYRKLTIELAAIEMARIAKGDTSLTNKTYVWNLQSRTIKQNQLLKVPVCPVCIKNRVDHSGALDLPWGKR